MTRIEQKFYPLTAEISQKLRDSKLTAAEWRLWSYLVELDPFGDRYSDLPDTLTIMQAVDIKKTTFYTAIAKFQELGLFDFQEKGFSFRNLRGIPKNRKTVQFVGSISEISENSLENRKTVQFVGNDFENSENQPLKPLPLEDSGSPQTIQIIQTIQTFQTEGGGDEKNDDGNSTNGIDDTNDIKEKILVQENHLNSQISPTEKTTKEIPRDLIDKLSELEIPLDAVVRKAITAHDLSQAWGAIRHIENTRETIKNPRSVFLYQLPKQTVDKSKPKPLSKEFLDWYQYVRGEKVVDVPPEYLSLDRYGEPKVRLKSDPHRLVDWRRVRDDAGLEQVATPEQFKRFMEKIRAMAAKGGKGDGSST